MRNFAKWFAHQNIITGMVENGGPGWRVGVMDSITGYEPVDTGSIPVLFTKVQL